MEFFSLAFFEGKESDPPSRALATEGWGTNPGSQDRGVRQGHCTPVLYVILKHSLPEQGRTFFIVCVCVCVCVCVHVRNWALSSKEQVIWGVAAQTRTCKSPCPLYLQVSRTRP